MMDQTKHRLTFRDQGSQLDQVITIMAALIVFLTPLLLEGYVAARLLLFQPFYQNNFVKLTGDGT